jgi:aminobenzoyl-glutamate utilization protein B
MRRTWSVLVPAFGVAALVIQPIAGQGPDVARLKQEAFAAIDANADRLGRIGDAIFSYAEIGFQEVKTVALLGDTLEKAGFKVERGVAEMPTAYRATYGSGTPVIGLMADYDCVPGANQRPGVVSRSPMVAGAPGHGEGHNTNPPTVIGAALAIKSLIEQDKLAGTIVVYGGPAEEIVASRGYMVNAGLFKGVDAAMDAHVGSGFGTSYGLNNLAIVSVQWTFHGEAGHGATPWTGRSALKGVEVFNVSMNIEREHMPLEMRFHYVITNGGEQPNVIPEEATVWYYLRERDYPRLLQLLDRARRAAQGAAAATETTVTERILSGSWPVNGNRSLAELLQKNIAAVGMPQWTREDEQFAEAFQRAMRRPVTGLATAVEPIKKSAQGSSSSDVGDVTWNVPYARMQFPSNVAGTLGGHHWSAAIAVATPVAHKGIVVGAKALAGTVVDLLTDPSHLKAIKADFARDTAELPWKSIIPAGSRPPTFLNAGKMDRFRAELAKFYYDPASPKTLLEEWGIPYPPPLPVAPSPQR